MKDTPCYGCFNRHILCHADCHEYLDFKKKIAEQKEKILSELKAYRDFREEKKRINRIAEMRE